MNVLSRVHLSVEAKFYSEHFQFLTRHCCQKLGLSIEVDFLNESKTGLISSQKPKFKDEYKIFWLGRTPGKSNHNLNLDQKN